MEHKYKQDYEYKKKNKYKKAYEYKKKYNQNHKHTIRIKCSLLLACLLIFLSGCGSGNTGKKTENRYVVGVVTKSGTSEFWMQTNAGMEDAAAKYDMDIISMAPDSELDREVQEKQVQKLMERNVDVLAIAPIDSYHMPQYMEEIRDKNIPVVSFDTEFDNSEFYYIGIDNKTAGYNLAKTLAKQLGHKGNVGIVAGDLNQQAHKDRVEGFKEYMESEKDIHIEFIESGYANLQMSEQKVRDLMKKHPKINGIMATSAVTAMGLVDELKGNNIKIATFDEQEDSLEAVKKGQISALAAQSGYKIGYETIRYIQKLRNGEKVDKKCYLDLDILTKENVEEYRRAYED